MMAKVRQLADLVPPVPGAAVSPDWRTAEARLSLRLPSDYKQLVGLYGWGGFEDFLWLLHPTRNANMDLESQNRIRLQALAALELEPPDARLQSLVAWGITDNADTCFWIAESRAAPEAWTIVVNAGSDPEWECFPGGVADFLLAVFNGAFRSSVFPEDWPNRLDGKARGGDSGGY